MENEVAEPGAVAPLEPEPVPATGGCVSCGAAMTPEQDWCLTCGTAAPGRVDERAGMRTAVRVAALTLALLGTAVAASYAALTHGSETTLVASIPVAAAPAATTATTAAPAPKPKPKPKPTPTPSHSIPVAPDTTPTVTPAEHFPTVTSTPTTTVTPTPTPRVTPPTTTATTKTPTAKTTKIALAKDAISVFDPFSRAVNPTAPADLAALTDADPSTVWTVSIAQGTPNGVQVGLVIDLGTVRKASLIKLQTPTPGFSVEIYGAPAPTSTTGPPFPPSLPDAGWTHLRNAADLGSVDGNADIHLGIHGKGVSTFRYLLVWLTHQPPVPAGTRDVPASTDTTPVVTPTVATATVPVITPPATDTTTGTVPPPAIGATVSIAELSVFG